jgi:hypothetical protein
MRWRSTTNPFRCTQARVHRKTNTGAFGVDHRLDQNRHSIICRKPAVACTRCQGVRAKEGAPAANDCLLHRYAASHTEHTGILPGKAGIGAIFRRGRRTHCQRRIRASQCRQSISHLAQYICRDGQIQKQLGDLLYASRITRVVICKGGVNCPLIRLQGISERIRCQAKTRRRRKTGFSQRSQGCRLTTDYRRIGQADLLQSKNELMHCIVLPGKPCPVSPSNKK